MNIYIYTRFSISYFFLLPFHSIRQRRFGWNARRRGEEERAEKGRSGNTKEREGERDATERRIYIHIYRRGGGAPRWFPVFIFNMIRTGIVFIENEWTARKIRSRPPGTRVDHGRPRVGDDGRDGGGRRWWVGRCGGWMDGLVGR